MSEQPYFRLRVPEELKKKISKAAAENHRSMTAEILSRLEDSFDIVDVNSEVPPAWLTGEEAKDFDMARAMARMEVLLDLLAANKLKFSKATKKKPSKAKAIQIPYPPKNKS